MNPYEFSRILKNSVEIIRIFPWALARDRIYPRRGMTFWKLCLGCLQHESKDFCDSLHFLDFLYRNLRTY